MSSLRRGYLPDLAEPASQRGTGGRLGMRLRGSARVTARGLVAAVDPVHCVRTGSVPSSPHDRRADSRRRSSAHRRVACAASDGCAQPAARGARALHGRSWRSQTRRTGTGQRRAARPRCGAAPSAEAGRRAARASATRVNRSAGRRRWCQPARVGEHRHPGARPAAAPRPACRGPRCTSAASAAARRRNRIRRRGRPGSTSGGGIDRHPERWPAAPPRRRIRPQAGLAARICQLFERLTMAGSATILSSAAYACRSPRRQAGRATPVVLYRQPGGQTPPSRRQRRALAPRP